MLTSIQRHIPVDIYGGCGPLKFEREKQWVNKEKLTLMAEYKFYLAFENANCMDYITEKTWNHLGNGIIPVVMGGANYSAVLPQWGKMPDFSSYLVIIGEKG